MSGELGAAAADKDLHHVQVVEGGHEGLESLRRHTHLKDESSQESTGALTQDRQQQSSI